VVVITAFGIGQTVFAEEFNGQVDACTLGASAVLSKPIDYSELRSILDTALTARKRKLHRGIRAWVRNWIPPLLVLLLMLASWELCCRSFDIKEYLIPAPSRVADVFAHKFMSLLRDTGITAAEALLGFLAANVLSLVIAIGFCHWAWLERSFYPYVIALKSVPVIAIAPLLVLWCGYGMTGKVIMAGIISFFPLVVNATLGLKSVDPEALDLMHSLSASRTQILVKLRLPNAVPYIFSALKMSAALAVVGAIVGELTGAKGGIGFVILMASYNIDTPMLFAAIICASSTGILFFGGVAWFEACLKRRYGFAEPTQKEVTP
jgi:NitT/TauT family transport system permease protein